MPPASPSSKTAKRNQNTILLPCVLDLGRSLRNTVAYRLLRPYGWMSLEVFCLRIFSTTSANVSSLIVSSNWNAGFSKAGWFWKNVWIGNSNWNHSKSPVQVFYKAVSSQCFTLIHITACTRYFERKFFRIHLSLYPLVHEHMGSCIKNSQYKLTI